MVDILDSGTATRVREIVSAYGRITAYCDGLFRALRNRHGAGMRCAEGCDACCVLETVGFVEACVIASALRGAAGGPGWRNGVADTGLCAFLVEGRCAVYASRPLICRTHGMPILDTSTDPPSVNCCERNFEGGALELLDRECMFDQERVVANLERLNLALALALGAGSAGGRRYPLADLARGRLPAELESAIRSIAV